MGVGAGGGTGGGLGAGDGAGLVTGGGVLFTELPPPQAVNAQPATPAISAGKKRTFETL